LFALLTDRPGNVFRGGAREYEDSIFVDEVRFVMDGLDEDASIASLDFQRISR
jgi:hypothetical protein